VLSALLMCGFPGLAMYSLLEDSSDNNTSNFQQLYLHAVETMLPYTTPYVYPGELPHGTLYTQGSVYTRHYYCVAPCRTTPYNTVRTNVCRMAP
jgi:hypothetical protein